MVTAAPVARTDIPQARPQPVPIRSAPQCAAVSDESRDDALVRARTGDQAAFAVLIRRHQNMVFSVALHMLRSRAAAEDMAQEVFLELYRSLDRLESDAHVVAWLRRVTGHRCIDEIRRRRHRPECSTETLPEASQAPATRDVFGVERLRALVAGLPARARMVVVLRYQEDMDPMEIASVLRMPINTVKSHLRRSIAALRESLMGGSEP